MELSPLNGNQLPAYGITSVAALEEVLLCHRGKIVGLLFCSYREGEDTLNSTWPRSFDDWHLYSAANIDIVAAGYAVHGASPGAGWIKVRELDLAQLWFSRTVLFDCIEFVEERVGDHWHPSGKLDLVFLEVSGLGINWNNIAAIDVAKLLDKQVYSSVDQLMFELISTFKNDPPKDVSELYREVVKLPIISKRVAELGRDAPKLIAEALKLWVN